MLDNRDKSTTLPQWQ